MTPPASIHPRPVMKWRLVAASEEHRKAQIALLRVEEDRNADGQKKNSDQKQEPPMTDGTFRIFNEERQSIHNK
jgi:hypothetical protein